MRGGLQRGKWWVVAGALALVAACADDAVVGPVTTSSTNIKFISGYDLVDTANARPIQALVVEIRDDDGVLLTGAVVRFESAPLDSAQPWSFGVYVGAVDAVNFSSWAAAATNDRGQAAVRVMMGPRAGVGAVKVIVPELGIQDTAYYGIQPGAAAGLTALPNDTALYAGASLQMRGAVVDRNGNPRGDPVSYGGASGPITLTAAGRVTAGASPGRAWFLVQGNGLADTAWISVVPQGVIAAVKNDSVVTFSLDGSGYRPLAQASGSYGVAPRWNPAGSRVIYASGGYGTTHLYTVDAQGQASRLLPTQPPDLLEESWADYARDGLTVFFSGRDASTNFALWRASATGTGAYRFGRDVGSYGIDWRPSPSPSGDRVAFVTAGGGAEIRVLTVATGAVSAWGQPGQVPRWSPTGETIAFVAEYGGALRLMNSDGTNVRTIGGTWYSEGTFDWSPDGLWLVVRTQETLELINVQSGLRLPLGYATRFTQPSWRP